LQQTPPPLAAQCSISWRNTYATDVARITTLDHIIQWIEPQLNMMMYMLATSRQLTVVVCIDIKKNKIMFFNIYGCAYLSAHAQLRLVAYFSQ